jgi:hypothetical protein
MNTCRELILPGFIEFYMRIICWFLIVLDTDPTEQVLQKSRESKEGYSVEGPGCTIPTMNIQQCCSAVSRLMRVSRTMRDEGIHPRQRLANFLVRIIPVLRQAVKVF